MRNRIEKNELSHEFLEYFYSWQPFVCLFRLKCNGKTPVDNCVCLDSNKWLVFDSVEEKALLFINNALRDFFVAGGLDTFVAEILVCKRSLVRLCLYDPLSELDVDYPLHNTSQ